MPIIRRTAEQIRKSGGRIDWDRVRRTTDAEIARQIAEDPDTAPDMTKALLGKDPRFRRVYHPPVPDVKKIRRKLKLSQAEFASRFGFSVRTVQQWEQGRAVPDRPARILLKVIETSPKAIDRALRRGRAA